MVITLMAAIAMIAWAGNHVIGHLVHDRVSLQRAADAAAYGAAIAQARALNLHAYLNRAQLAHQVAMAHLISVASAERFRAMQSRQSLAFNPPVSLIGMLFGKRYASAYLAARASGSDVFSMQQLEQAFIRHDDLVHDIIDATRMHVARELPAQRQEVIRRLLVSNIGGSGSSLRGESLESLGIAFELLTDDWPGSVVSQRSDAPAWQRLLFAVTRQHGYLNQRNGIRRNHWVVSVRCPHKRHELRRRGETTLDDRGYWRSSDTLSFHALRSNQTIGCYQREYPMGWALLGASGPGVAPMARDTAPEKFSDQAFWRWVGRLARPDWDIFNGHANRLAESWARGTQVTWKSRGHPAFADLAASRRGPVRIALQVTQDGAGRERGERLMPWTTAFRLLARYEATPDSLRADSAAQTFFSRYESRADGMAERPNLFHPYWHARLIAVPERKKPRFRLKGVSE